MDIQVATRPVRPDDEQRFHRLWPRLSPDTVYRRFHSPLRTLPPAVVHRLGVVDHDRREALVAVVGGEVVGGARYHPQPRRPARAEVPLLVEDAWPGQGVGPQFPGEGTALAGPRPVRTLTAP